LVSIELREEFARRSEDAGSRVAGATERPVETKHSKPAGARPLRIALLADHLVTVGGAERVFLHMIEAFPEADIFALSYNPKATLAEFGNYSIRTHPMAALFSTHQRFKLMFLPATFVMERWQLGDYDVVLSASATSAKYLARQSGRHICYCYFPTRAIWQEKQYFVDSRRSLARRAFQACLPFLQRRDRAAAQRVDDFIAISETTQRAIRHIYGRESRVLFSPICVDTFRRGLEESKQDFYLIVSRLEQWKRVDYAIAAFNRLGLPLHIVGTGEDESRLRAMAGANIRFLGQLSMDELVRQYGQARAVIFTPALEYGLVPLEAVAAGTPVIALGFGGVRETMLAAGAARERGTPPTAVFYYKQTAEDLAAAFHEFEQTSFSRAALSAYAERFGVPAFQEHLRDFVYGRESMERPALAGGKTGDASKV
jgi:glycosyltransferase involved in cell wall biosynthesis